MNENELEIEDNDADFLSDQIDPNLTLTLAQASVAAYNAYDGQTFLAPPNYKYIGYFKGWDGSIGNDGEAEPFGLIFKYNGPQMIANRFIVAFRGTDSWYDVYEDAFWDFSSFIPYQNFALPAPNVCTGFYDIYTTMGGDMKHPMREQIFNALSLYPKPLIPPKTPTHQPSEVLITGHSLGAALSQLFTLDMKISFPHVRIKNINFASPRVGDSTWQSACDDAGATQRITRVINHWDIVPDAPPEFFDYVSIGKQFETAFYRYEELFPSKLADHSILNLQTVLQNCVYRDPQVWQGTFTDATDTWFSMYSTTVPASDAAKREYNAKLKELAEIRRKATA